MNFWEAYQEMKKGEHVTRLNAAEGTIYFLKDKCIWWSVRGQTMQSSAPLKEPEIDDEWEVVEKRITITKSQFVQIIKDIKIKRDKGYSPNDRMLLNSIAIELGF